MLLLPAPAGARPAQRTTVDAVVASVDGTAITLSDVERAYRLELFFEGKPCDATPDAAAIALGRDHLIDQALLLLEAEAENVNAADSRDAATRTLEEARKKYGDETTFQSALRSLGMSEQEVIERLGERDRILRLIERRLRPSAEVEDAEIDAYYRDVFVPGFTQRSQGRPPALSEVADQIRAVLVEKRVNELLEAWLGNLKASHSVRIYSISQESTNAGNIEPRN